jgi:dihydrofolate reductase
MRKLILYMHVSADGFVEGENGDMTWMQPDDEHQWSELFEFLKDVDLFLLGRGMWPGYSNHWKKALVDQSFSANEIKYAKLAEKTHHIVFSKTLKDPAWENTTVVAGDVVDEVKQIKQQAGKNIQIVGGAKFAATLIDSGLVDEYRILINPAVVTEGKSFFRQLKTRRSLELTDVQKFSNGVVLHIYKNK